MSLAEPEASVAHYDLFFIDIASRSVHIASITPHPDNSWMTQIARKITDVNDRFLRSNSSSFTTSPNGLGSVFRQSARSINVRTPSGLYWADGLWAAAVPTTARVFPIRTDEPTHDKEI